MNDPDEPSAIHRAVMRHSVNETLSAIQSGSDVNDRDIEGRTPIFYAAKEGDTALVEELVRFGADVNAIDVNSETALHFACREYRPDAVQLLITSGALVDAQDVHGNTPLWRAVFESRGRGEIINLLRSNGSNPDLSNKHGVSPRSLAATIANYNVSQFFV